MIFMIIILPYIKEKKAGRMGKDKNVLLQSKRNFKWWEESQKATISENNTIILYKDLKSS